MVVAEELSNTTSLLTVKVIGWAVFQALRLVYGKPVSMRTPPRLKIVGAPGAPKFTSAFMRTLATSPVALSGEVSSMVLAAELLVMLVMFRLLMGLHVMLVPAPVRVVPAGKPTVLPVVSTLPVAEKLMVGVVPAMENPPFQYMEFASTGPTIVTVPVKGRVADSVSPALVAVAFALNSNSVGFVMLATLVDAGMPVPVTVIPTTRPAVLSHVTVVVVIVVAAPVRFRMKGEPKKRSSRVVVA
jgi:hypothetical protein